MTRVTNFGRKRTYLEAGLSKAPDDVESDPTPDAAEVEQGENETQAVTQPPKKKSKKNKKKKKVEGEETDAAGPSQPIQPKQPSKQPSKSVCLLQTCSIFLTDSTRSQRASGIGIRIEAAKAHS